MVVVMEPGASEDQISVVVNKLTKLGFDSHRSDGKAQTVIGAIGDKSGIDLRDLEVLDGVREVVRISEPYKLVSRTFKNEDTIITIKHVEIGGQKAVTMAGPCSVETAEQVCMAAKIVKEGGAEILRGGAFKPRTSPYSFQGLGEEGLKYMRDAADEFGLLVVSEIMDARFIDTMMPYVDIFQVGTRNMQNYTLLRDLGSIRKPVLLKRGMSATVEEFLMAAEYIMSGGNHQVILCERGIRTFEIYTRFTLDLSVIPVIKKLSHLPIIVDPSHGTGRRNKVAPMARASIAAGADGLMIELHHNPDEALSDGAQALYPAQFLELMQQCRIIAKAINRTI